MEGLSMTRPEVAAMAEHAIPEWEVAVSAHNEAAHLPACLRALALAGQGHRMAVTVLLNGSTDRSPEVAMAAMREAGLRGRVVRIPHADKSNAFNQYAYRLRGRAPVQVFVDAYATVAPDALALLAAALRDAPAAQAAAAVPSSGPSAPALRAQMIEMPGLHGSLFALRGAFLDRFVAAGLRLPLGLYRGDGLLSSLVLHDLDALGGDWQHERIVVEPRATWTAPVVRPWRWRDARRQARRLVQQARGRLQWPVVKDRIYDRAAAAGFAALPPQADEAALAWIAADPARRPSWWKDPFGALAVRRMRAAPAAPAERDLLPQVLMETAP